MEDESDIPGVSEDAEPFPIDDEFTEEDELAIAEAEADIAAGRVIPHEEVAAWLDTWGKSPRVPPPKTWFK